MSGFVWNRDMEMMPREQVRDLQRSRLREVVTRAWSDSPFYQQHLREHGIGPDSIVQLDDLRDVPFTVRGDFRDTYPFGMLAVPREDLRRVQASSGTRGTLTIGAYTTHDLEIWAEVCARSLAMGGVLPGDIVQIAFGYGLFTAGLGLHGGAERLGTTIVPAAAGNTLRQILLLRDLGARAFCSTPTYALILSEIMQQEQVDPRSLNLQRGIFGAEPWTEAMRQDIQERLNITAVDIYGLTEVIGPGVACECVEAQDGMHVAEDHFLVEVVNPTTGENVEDGHWGELVFTTLTREAQPVIRFRTGDISALIDAPCSCGRTHRRIARLRGRIDDMIVLHGVNVYPSEIEEVLLSHPDVTPFYQIIIDWDGRRESITVQAELAPDTSEHADPETIANLELRIARAIKTRFDLNMRVALLRTGELDRADIGNALRVVDRRE